MDTISHTFIWGLESERQAGIASLGGNTEKLASRRIAGRGRK